MCACARACKRERLGERGRLTERETEIEFDGENTITDRNRVIARESGGVGAD